MVALLGRILLAVLGNTALTQTILNALGIPAQQDTLLGVSTDAAISRSVLDWSDVSPGPLKTALIAIEADMATMSAAVLAAIANAQQAANPVILPTTPPAGYGGGDVSGVAEDVWNYILVTAGRAAGDVLSDAGAFVLNWDDVNGAVVDSTDARWLVGTSMSGTGTIYDIGHYDVNVDYDTIISSDSTILDWLNRVYSDYGVTWTQYDSMCGFHDDTTGAFYYLNLTEQQFRLMRDASPSSLVLPPLWPSLPLVTLGTPVDLAAGLTITEHMDGVIVEITSAPTKQGYFTFDDVRSWRNIGALSFFDDNGQQERAQTMAFESGVYCPTTMVHAAGVKLRSSVDVVGTITPWVVRPP